MTPYSAPQQYPSSAAYAQQVARENATFMRKVYAIMAGGLTATAVASVVVASSETLMRMVFGNPIVFYGLLVAELVMVWSFSSLAQRMSSIGAGLLFLIYAVTNGVTLAFIFMLYTKSSIASSFFITAGTFGAMSAYGYFTKRDLSGLGSFAMMGLIGLIIASVVNLFLGSPMIYWLTTFVGVIVFTALTAYDTNKIKQLNIIGNEGTDEDRKEAIHGALVLYLDFINLFLYLLRLFGRRR